MSAGRWQSDLRDAVAYLEEDWDDLDAKVASCRFVGVEQRSPLAVAEEFGLIAIDESLHTGEPLAPGWLRAHAERAWNRRLRRAYQRPSFAHIISRWRAGRLPPAVEVDGRMGDGLGRACFFYALGEPTMPVAVYRTESEA